MQPIQCPASNKKKNTRHTNKENMIHKQEKRQFKKEKKRPRGRQRQDFITVI